MREHENHDNLRILNENHESHGHLRIPCEKYENQKKMNSMR